MFGKIWPLRGVGGFRLPHPQGREVSLGRLFPGWGLGLGLGLGLEAVGSGVLSGLPLSSFVLG